MANTDDIVAALETLARAYPNQAITRATAEIYLRWLADIPGGLLRQAVERHIGESNYFPRIAQLRGIAARLAGTPRFDCLAPGRFETTPLRPGGGDDGHYRSQGNGSAGGDELAIQAQVLEDAFYQERRLDAQAWRALAEAFERAGRPQRGERTCRKLAGLQAVLEQEAAAVIG